MKKVIKRARRAGRRKACTARGGYLQKVRRHMRKGKSISGHHRCFGGVPLKYWKKPNKHIRY